MLLNANNISEAFEFVTRNHDKQNDVWNMWEEKKLFSCFTLELLLIMF